MNANGAKAAAVERDPWFPAFSMPAAPEDPIAMGYAKQQLAKAMSYLEQGLTGASWDAACRAVQALDDLRF